MEELKKIQIKQDLYNKDGFCLVVDSLNNEIINLEFQAIDNGLYFGLNQIKNQREDKLLKTFFSGTKINLSGAY